MLHRNISQEFEMSSQGEAGRSLGRRMLAVAVVGASLFLTSSGVLAQQASSSVTAESAALRWSVEQPNSTPRLVTAMLDDHDVQSYRTEKSSAETANPNVDQLCGSADKACDAALKPNNKPDFKNAKVYSLLDGDSVAGTFRYQHQPRYFKTDYSPDSAPSSQNAGPAARPLFQVGIGNWHLPVLLSAGSSE
jgi:hypothetical protein